MTRVKRNKIAMKRRRNILKAAKGYKFRRSKTEIGAKVALRHAGKHAFAHRKDKKNDMRRLWTVRLNAFLREEANLNYSSFINLLKKKNIEIDRKIMAEFALNNKDALKAIVNEVK